MPLLQEELRTNNRHGLMVAQQALNSQPEKAAQMFGLDEKTASFIKSLSPTQIERLAACGHATFAFRFTGQSIEFLQEFLNGDDMAMTQVILCDPKKGMAS